MSSLDMLSEDREDPLSVIDRLLSEEPDPHVYRPLLNGVDGAGMVKDWTPLMLLWDRPDTPSIKRNALKLVLFHGVDMNLTGGLGLNSLHLLVLRLFCCITEEEAIERLEDVEWWLRMGADPNTKLFLPTDEKSLVILTPLEFFLFLGQHPNFVPKGMERRFLRNHPSILKEAVQRRFYILLLCFDTEAPSAPYRDNLVYKNCAELRLRDITHAMLQEHVLLRQRLRDHYKLSIDWKEDDLEERHRTLQKKFPQCSPPPPFPPLSPSSIVIQTESCEHDGQTPLDRYFSVVVGNGNRAFFHGEMVARLLRDDRNPCTNTPFSSTVRWEWLHRLESGEPCFPYHSLEENKALFPRIFHTTEKPYETRMLLEKLHDRMSRAHPFSNLLHLQNYENYRLSYLCSILQGDTYRLTEVKNVDTLQDLLKAMMLAVYRDRDKIATIHFAVEEAHEDLLLYDTICSYFEKNQTAFIFSFYEAITHLDLFRLLSARVGYASLGEMALLWYKMSNIYTFHHSLEICLEDGMIVIQQQDGENEEEEAEFESSSREEDYNHFPIIILSSSTDEDISGSEESEGG
jgi:hypothetical protein